jgi:hypothetical protein
MYSKGKLELITNALIIAISLTYFKVSTVDRFWDILREYFRNIDQKQVMYRSALYHAFISMHYESLIEK